MSGNRLNSILELPAQHRAAAAQTLAGQTKVAQVKAAPAVVKPNKYRNRKVEFDGYLFDSIKEMHRYQFLKMQESDGAITELKLQLPLQIIVNGHFIAEYICDFAYRRDGVRIIEDVKSTITRKLPVYRLKIKLIKAIYGYEVQEI